MPVISVLEISVMAEKKGVQAGPTSTNTLLGSNAPPKIVAA